MPKKKNNKPQREMTKRQLSHWQKQHRLQRIVTVLGIVVVVAILATVGTGLYMNKYKPYHAVVLKVGNKEYTMDYYINMLAYYGTLYGSPQMIPYLGDTVVRDIAQNQLIVEAAANDLGITVSDDEVNQEIKKENLSSDQTRIDAIRAKLVIQKLQNDYFDKQVPDTAEQRNVQAMFLASQSQVEAVKARLNAGEDFSDLAAQLSLEKTSVDNRGDFGWVPQGVLSAILNKGNSNTPLTDKVLDNQVFNKNTSVDSLTSVEDKDQQKNMGYWLVEVTDTRTVNATPSPASTATPSPTSASSSTQKHVLTMLLGSEQQVNDIKAKLEQGGKGNDWATLAKANSTGSKASSGGDWGFVSKGTLPEAVDQLVFPSDSGQALAVNTISNPVPDTTQSTKGGFWLVKVNGIENKTITDSDRTILAQNLLNDWINKVWTDHQSEVHNLLTQQQKSFAIAQAEKR